MQNPAVVSLAILSVNFGQSKSYLDNFVPMVNECVRLSDDDVVSLPALQDAIADQFGLRIPQNAILSIVRRSQKAGCIYYADGAYHRNRDELAKSNFRAVQQDVLRMHSTLVASLLAFAQSEFGTVWSTHDAENALQDYIQNNEVAILAGSREGVLANVPPHVRYSRYVVARYAQHVGEQHTGDFDYFETIVKGSMLASGTFLPDPERVSARFDNQTELYFDTPFLIYALGYGGEAQRDPCLELLALLRETGAGLRCFRHTLDEVHAALEACARQMGNRAITGPIRRSVEYFIEIHADPADVLRYAGRVEQDLESLHIRVVDTPPYRDYEFVIDEVAFNHALEERFAYGATPRERDVASIAAIIRLRRGQAYYLIEHCRAVFVTTNGGLAHLAREFVEQGLGETSVAPCITDHALTTVLWLKRPTDAPDLPRKRIIADCYAATQPSDQLFRRYLEKVDALEAEGNCTENDYYLLRHTMEARNALMDKTFGEEDAFTQGTVAEILDVVKASVEGEARDRYEQVQVELADARRGELERTSRVRLRSVRIARRITWAAKGVVLSVMAAAALVLFPWQLPSFGSQIPRYVGAGATLLLFVAFCVNLYAGGTVKGIAARVEDWLGDRIERIFVGE